MESLTFFFFLAHGGQNLNLKSCLLGSKVYASDTIYSMTPQIKTKAPIFMVIRPIDGLYSQGICLLKGISEVIWSNNFYFGECIPLVVPKDFSKSIQTHLRRNSFQILSFCISLFCNHFVFKMSWTLCIILSPA